MADAEVSHEQLVIEGGSGKTVERHSPVAALQPFAHAGRQQASNINTTEHATQMSDTHKPVGWRGGEKGVDGMCNEIAGQSINVLKCVAVAKSGWVVVVVTG